MSSPDLDAGRYSTWLLDTVDAIAGRQDADVPCDGCTACCRSGQFVHIAPDEADTLAHIPSALLFPAPRMPRGHVLMGYDGDGRCPMLVDDRCSIYAHRPRTCRTYDCRVFPAAGIDADDDKPAIRERARRWRFQHPESRDQVEHDAVRAAAAFLAAHRPDLPDDVSAHTATQLAIDAVHGHRPFLNDARPDVDSVVVAIRTQRASSSRNP